MDSVKLSIVLVSLVFLASCSKPVPSDPVVDEVRLQRIDNAINAAIDNGEIAGAVGLFAVAGDTVYEKAFGYADIASGEVMRTDHIFRIASMTKAVTTTAAMILYEQGHFRLNDPISDYLPEFSDMRVVSEVDDAGNIIATVPAEQPIRVIHLLTHSAGIGYPFIPSDVSNAYVTAGVIDGLTEADVVLGDQMRLLAQQPLLFQPGSEFAYGLNSDLLGYYIEVVSGQPLDQFVAKNITAPLQMNDTWFYMPEDQSERLVTLYAHVDGEGLVVSQGGESEIKLDNPNYPIEGAMTYFSGGAGLSSTASDYARFIQMLLNDGELDGQRILSRKSVELMRTARVDWNDDEVPDFALGFQVLHDLGARGELGSVGTYSWGGAFNTTFWIDPAEDLIAFLMTQARPVESDIRAKFSTLVYQAID